MSSDCLKVNAGSPWLDTVDQEHIPLRVSNYCEEEVLVELEALTPQGSSLQRVSLKVPASATREVEVITDLYLQKVLVRGRWRKSEDKEWREIKELEILLR